MCESPSASLPRRQDGHPEVPIQPYLGNIAEPWGSKKDVVADRHGLRDVERGIDAWHRVRVLSVFRDRLIRGFETRQSPWRGIS